MIDTAAPVSEADNTIGGKPLRRRHLGTMPGDHLLMPSGDSTAYTQVFHDFLEATQLPPTMLNPSRLCMVPIPTHTYREELREQPVSIWANPLFWLPRDWRVNEAGATDDLMGLRITWELTFSGLYEPEIGFADILFAHGIDVDTDAGASRVSAWLAGGSDPVLDAIDITDMLARPESEDEDWIHLLAYEALPGTLQTVWGLNANSTLDMLSAAVSEYRSDGDDAALNRALEALLTLGSAIFEDIIYDGVEASEALTALADHLCAHPDQNIGSAIVFRNFLRFVSANNADAVEEFIEEIGSEPEEVDVDAEQEAAAEDSDTSALPDLPDTLDADNEQADHPEALPSFDDEER